MVRRCIKELQPSTLKLGLRSEVSDPAEARWNRPKGRTRRTVPPPLA